jgi:hypothetical protein
MDLYLRKSDDGQLGPEIYRVVLKDDGDEVEIGSISVKHSASTASETGPALQQHRAAWELSHVEEGPVLRAGLPKPTIAQIG